MNFLLPFWWDHVYDDFDEWEETWTNGIENYKFLWELNDTVPMDGVLFSRNDMEDSPRRKEKVIEAGGIKNFLRLPDDLVLFGDCGAYGYIDENEPPYDPVETLEFYEQMQYDQACTVDHLITSANMDEKEERLEITLSNAGQMIEAYRDGEYSFDLFGVVQGWDPDSYYRAAERLIDLGFDHLAIGGLVRTSTKDIIKILQRCYPLWMNKDVDVHLFGIARWELFPFMERYSVNSLDNAYHRRAWLDKKNNYELDPSTQYTAVRIPISDQYSDDRLPEEQAVFDELRAYMAGEASPEDLVTALEEYEKVYAELKDKESRVDLFKDLRDEYLRTLRDRPWKQCDCHICNEYGAHVAIFRRNERNMRRGFHNLYRFYTFFTAYLNDEVEPPEKTWKYTEPEWRDELDVEDFEDQNVLVISSCSKTKKTESPDKELPAKEMYQGRLFNHVRSLCTATGWDHRIISARFGLLSPDDLVTGYDETLQTQEEVRELRDEVVPALAEDLHEYDAVLVLAGKKYRQTIEPLMDYRFHFVNSAGYPALCAKIKEATPIESPELQDFT